MTIQELKKKVRSYEDNSIHLKREIQRLEADNSKQQRKVEQLLKLSEGGRNVSIPAEVKRDIEKGIYVRQLKAQINTLRDELHERENDIENLKRNLRYTNLLELEKEKEEYLSELQRLQPLLKDLKEELHREKQRREWNHKVLGGNSEDLQTEVARLALGYQSILSNISSKHGEQLTRPVSAHLPVRSDALSAKNNRPHSANPINSMNNKSKQVQEDIVNNWNQIHPILDEDPLDSFASGLSLSSHLKINNNTNNSSVNGMINHNNVNISSIKQVNNFINGNNISDRKPLYNIHQLIKGLYRNGVNWYNGKIKSFNSIDHTYCVEYDDGDEEEGMTEDRIKPIDVPVPVIESKDNIIVSSSTYKVNDKVSALYYNGSTRYSAKIEAVVALENGTFVYDILYDDGDREKRVLEKKKKKKKIWL